MMALPSEAELTTASSQSPLPPPPLHLTPVTPPAPQLQQQSGSSSGAAAPLNATLYFDEVAKHFSVPIAEAATTLGVCSSVLKKICRDNGIIRWPYRKFLAGKTVEDIKKDAAREKNKELAELSKAARERMDLSTITPSTSVVPSSTFGTQLQNRIPSQVHETSKLQRVITVPGQVLQHQGNKLLQDERQNMLHSSHTRSIPNYIDEFKHGFPVNGLSSASVQWWGSGSSEGTLKSQQGEPVHAEAEKQQADESSMEEASRCAMVDENPDGKTEENGSGSQPVSLLCSVRKQAVVDGYKSLKLGVSRGYKPYDLEKREKLVLVKVFKSSLPSQWRYCFS